MFSTDVIYIVTVCVTGLPFVTSTGVQALAPVSASTRAYAIFTFAGTDCTFVITADARAFTSITALGATVGPMATARTGAEQIPH